MAERYGSSAVSWGMVFGRSDREMSIPCAFLRRTNLRAFIVV
jgi:hypothetical protein